MQGLTTAVQCILRVASNATEQRDERRDTPLMLARKRSLVEVEVMLLAAGAKDLPCYTRSVGQIAWSAGKSISAASDD